eukprot:3324556-Prymnesium_polylepis.1
MEAGRGEGNAQSYSRGGSDGPELVGCVSCALCAVLKLRVTSYAPTLEPASRHTRRRVGALQLYVDGTRRLPNSPLID